MKHFFFIILSISFLMTETYSWEDGGTILGSYGNILESATANVGETNGITPYDGDFMLTVSESPIDGTPIAYIAWVTDLSEGDEIQACFYGYDNTPNTSPSMRIWEHGLQMMILLHTLVLQILLQNKIMIILQVLVGIKSVILFQLI